MSHVTAPVRHQWPPVRPVVTLGRQDLSLNQALTMTWRVRQAVFATAPLSFSLWLARGQSFWFARATPLSQCLQWLREPTGLKIELARGDRQARPRHHSPPPIYSKQTPLLVPPSTPPQNRSGVCASPEEHTYTYTHIWSSATVITHTHSLSIQTSYCLLNLTHLSARCVFQIMVVVKLRQKRDTSDDTYFVYVCKREREWWKSHS